MHRRYLIFKDVVQRFGAQWDQPTNAVTASDDVWEKIMKVQINFCVRTLTFFTVENMNHHKVFNLLLEYCLQYNWFAGAYYYNGEPEHSKLACLFGMDDVKVEGENEVIVISDSTEKLPTEEMGPYDIGELNDEVNSPLVFPPPTVCRKLFEGNQTPTDRESTTDVGIYFIDLTHDGQLRSRFEKGPALPPPSTFKDKAGVSKATEVGPSRMLPHASSCGSNSPLGKWSHLKK